MDNLTQRRILMVIGVVLAFLGLTSFLWGMLNSNYLFLLAGAAATLASYVLTVVVGKLREKAQLKKT